MCSLNSIFLTDFPSELSIIDSGFFFIFYLFMAEVGLNCCMWALSSCSKWGLLSSCCMRASHCGEVSCCGAETLRVQASVVAMLWLICPMACVIFPDLGLKPCSLHGQAGS